MINCNILIILVKQVDWESGAKYHPLWKSTGEICHNSNKIEQPILETVDENGGNYFVESGSL